MCARTGVALVLSAPSGAGKSTLARRLLAASPRLRYSISCTTRAPRQGETEGRDYHFISRADFEARAEEGAFAEWAIVHGNFYGTPLAPLREALAQGCDILFDIDVQGAAQLRLALPEAVLAFILPPSLEELEARLRGRGLDDEASISRRLANARSELAQAMWYDAVIVNDDLETACADLLALYRSATLSPARRRRLLAALCVA